MSETEMKPISSLSGSFDGGGHTISSLTVTGNNAGLFSQINSGSEVSNLILKDCDVTSTGTYSLSLIHI